MRGGSTRRTLSMSLVNIWFGQGIVRRRVLDTTTRDLFWGSRTVSGSGMKGRRKPGVSGKMYENGKEELKHKT